MSDEPHPNQAQGTDKTTEEPGTPLGQVLADRPCAQCGYNLIGQPIIRHEEHGFIGIRCPECGSAAAIQDYPLLGPWRRRLGVFAALLTIALTIGLLAAHASITAAIATNWNSDFLNSVGVEIARDYVDVFEAAEVGSGLIDPEPWNDSPIRANAYTNVDPAWWDKQDRKAYFTDAGGLGAALVEGAAWSWVGVIITQLSFGVFWGCLLMHRRGLLLAAHAVLPLAAAALFTWALEPNSGWQYGGWTPNGRYLAAQLVSGSTAPIVLGVSSISLVVALLIARPLMRLVLTVLLPPHLRSPLARLWLCDKKSVSSKQY